MRETLRRRKPTTTHGFTGRPFYNIYKSINQRCNNPRNRCWKNYGGRGIKNQWHRFETFKADMYDGYLEHLALYGSINTTIERIDNDGPYCRDNCRWATRREQNENRRSNPLVRTNGKALLIRDWVKLLGTSRSHYDYVRSRDRLTKAATIEAIISELRPSN